MRLGLNTGLYEVAGWPIGRTLKSAGKLGFEFIDHAAWRSGDPCSISRDKARDVVKIYGDLGLKVSQVLLFGTGEMADKSPAKRAGVMRYMKKCAEFTLELGARQVLVCWGGGLLQPDVRPEQSWMYMIEAMAEYCRWGLDKGLLVDLEMDPHVYFVVNSVDKMARVAEEIESPNFFPNVDIGHLCITREGPERLEKISRRIIHIHISETESFEHTNSIIGAGVVDFKSYIDKCTELGIEENCRRLGETAVAGIEMAEPGMKVDDPERWVRESLIYLHKILPDLKK